MVVKVGKILIPVNGSGSADVAVRFGIEFAKEKNATVYAVHVRDLNSLDAVEHLDGETHECDGCLRCIDSAVLLGKKAGVKVVPLVHNGDPAKIIAEMSQDFDLIIMGTVGRTGISHAVIGSTAEKVVRNAKCSVLVVRNHRSSNVGMSATDPTI